MWGAYFCIQVLINMVICCSQNGCLYSRGACFVLVPIILWYCIEQSRVALQHSKRSEVVQAKALQPR